MDHKRQRSQSVCFRATPEERREIEARITVSGLPKAEYYIQSLLHQRINIIVGKYQSDRLSLEIRRLRELMEAYHTEDTELLRDCKALLGQLLNVISDNSESTAQIATELHMGK